jgi:hypothetical protein
MFPAFWNPESSLFYFMVCVGDDSERSLELWEYDLVHHHLTNIGDTNGHAFISPDGRWVVWETGYYLNPGGLNPPIHSGLICLYETDKKLDYQLTHGPVTSFFQKWKAPSGN